MSTTTPKSALAQLTTAEQTLAAAIQAAAAKVDQIATTSIDDALAQLAESVTFARQRLQTAALTVNMLTGMVLGDVEALTAGIVTDLQANDVTNPTPTAPDANLPPMGVPAANQPSGLNGTAPTSEPAEVRSMAEWSEMFGTRLEATPAVPASQDEVIDRTCPTNSVEQAVETPSTPASVEPAPESPAGPIAAPAAIQAFATGETFHSDGPVIMTAANGPIEPASEPSGEDTTSKPARKSRRTRKS